MNTKFHCIGMKETNGKGQDNGEFLPEEHATGLLYLAKAEKKLAKMSREKFNKLWDKELIKFGNEGYNDKYGESLRRRENMIILYQRGRNGNPFRDESCPELQDLIEHGKRDAARA